MTEAVSKMITTPSIRCAYGDLEVVFSEDPVPDAVPQGTILVES